MRLILLTCLTMCAFAANSILTRLAIEPGHIDALSFAVLRVMAGAIVLSALVLFKGGKIRLLNGRRVISALSLAAYMIGFSLAYISLDAGLGALILFGAVQISMFAHGAVVSSKPTSRQIMGASVAFLGLMLALWPDKEVSRSGQLAGSALMVVAGIGWAAYTISGRSSSEPLASTAANFVLCLPLLMVVLFPFWQHASLTGLGLALICGAVTSGLGYALWYSVLPHLQQSVAAVVQLSVPVIAILAGSLFLGEALTLDIVIAAALVLSGIGLAVTSGSSPADRT